MRQIHGGFSLLELLMATAMISMICGMGMMRLGNSLAEHELSAAALELAADLRWMQQMAVNSPAIAGGPFYTLAVDHATCARYQITASAKTLKWTVLPASVRLQDVRDKVLFYSNGRPNQGRSFVLQSLPLRKNRFVILAAVTGRVRISDTPTWETGE